MRKFHKKARKYSFAKRLCLFRINRRIQIRLAVVLGALGILVWIYWGIPLPTRLSSSSIPVSSKIFDRNGKLIYEIYTDQRRTPIKLEELPAYVKESTISVEDKDFYKNKGFSITGMARALYNTVFKSKLQGGSTITQQLVKNSLLTPERTIKRKIREITLTIFVEAIYTKDQILELYLNQIPYGSSAYGIEAASELYLGKSAKDLSLAEAALMAGLPQSPTRYSPFGTHPEYAKERQKTVLKTMVDNKYLSQEEADKAVDEEIKYTTITPPQAPHFALWIKEQLVDKYGEAMVDKGGLRVITTLDLDLQKFSQDTVATEVARLKNQKVGNGAAIITRPKSGEILAMVGSKDYFAEDEDGKVNVIFAKRQPGSSIKPLNYALAIKDKKITLSTALTDVPTCFLVLGQPAYCPVNYDGAFHGLVQARFALGNSYNIPAVKVLALNGLDNFVDFAKQMGLTTLTDPSNYGLSLTLGGGEVRPYDMAVAFGVFANGGIKIPLVSILKVEDWKGKVYEEIKPSEQEGDRVLPTEVAFLVSHILYDNNARVGAFGESSYLNVSGHPEVSVKTGTTNDRRDNWTVGYTPQIVAVTWVGNNNNKSMGGAVSGVSGASPIWNRIIKKALDSSEKGLYNKEDDGHAWVSQPEGIVGKNICATDGQNPPGPDDNPDCPVRFEYFLKDSLPGGTSGARMDIQVDKTTGAIASTKTLPENIETQNHPVYTDPLGTIYCLDCQLPPDPISIRYPPR
jgi:penicillin-binding protein 1C